MGWSKYVDAGNICKVVISFAVIYAFVCCKSVIACDENFISAIGNT